MGQPNNRWHGGSPAMRAERSGVKTAGSRRNGGESGCAKGRCTPAVPCASMSCNLGVFVDQPADPVPASEAKTGDDATWGGGISGAA